MSDPRPEILPDSALARLQKSASVTDQLNAASVKYAQAKANAMSALSVLLVVIVVIYFVPMVLFAVKLVDFLRAWQP